MLPRAFLFVSVLPLLGCLGQAPPKVAAAPPAPQPAAVKAPEDPPIAFIQNAGVLPPAQAVPPAALPPLDPPAQLTERRTPETETAPRHRNQTAVAHRPVVEPLTTTTAAPPQSTAVTPSAPPAVPAGRPVLLENSATVNSALASKIAQVKANAARLSREKLTAKDARAFTRVQSFIRLADQAVARGELRQADELTDRAAMLAKALISGR